MNGKVARSKIDSNTAGKPSAAFRDSNGNAWSGRGPRSQWLRDALAAGRSLDEFRVGSRTTSPGAADSVSGETVAATPLPAGKKAKRTAKVRYRDAAGNSWSGMGPKPRWLKAALDAGTSLEDLAK